MKPGSEGGHSEDSEGYLSASEGRGTPNQASSPQHHSGAQAPPPLSHVPYNSMKSENQVQGITLPPTSPTPPNTMGHHQQGMAMHPLASSLAASQNRLKSPSLGQSPPQIQSVASLDSRSPPMTTQEL